MGDSRPDPSLPVPPPGHHRHNNYPKSENISMLCYALIIVGTASVILGVVNLFIIKWCTNRRRRAAGERASGTENRGFHNPRQNLLWSFKYKKGEGEGAGTAGQEQECAVCLSVFEEGEEVRQLPGCKHTFHAPCIGMWLSSHSSCPLCRTPVCERAVNLTITSMSNNSREGLLDSGSIP